MGGFRYSSNLREPGGVFFFMWDNIVYVWAGGGRAWKVSVIHGDNIVDVFMGTLEQVSVIHGDLRDVDLSEATVVVIYLLPDAIAEIAQPLLVPLLQRGKHAREESNPISPATRGDAHPPGHWPDKGAATAAEKGMASESHKKVSPCRIVCNTWGIPGARVIREASVGLYGGVTLRLFTSESLPPHGEGDDCGRA